MGDIFLFRVTGSSLGSSKRVVMHQLRGVGAEGDDDNAEPAADAEVFHPLGFMSLPTIPSGSDNKVTALGYRDGDDIHVLAVRDKKLAALGSEDLAAGDAVMFAPGTPATTFKLAANGDMTGTVASGQVATITANNATIQIDADGNITVTAANGKSLTVQNDTASAVISDGGDITATAGSTSLTLTQNGDATVDAGSNNVNVTGGNVILNSGSTPVAKEGSATTGHMHTFSGSVSGSTCSGTTVTATDTIATGAGSATVQVP